MNDEEDLCNLVAEIHTAVLGGLEPDDAVPQLESQGFSVDDANKLVALALCVGRIAVAQAEGREDSASLAELDSSGLHTDLCARLVEDATQRLAGNASGLSEIDQFAVDAGLNLEHAQELLPLSHAIVSDISKGKTREAVIARLEASGYMPGEEAEFVGQSLWAWQTAHEVIAGSGEMSDELLATDPPWAVYTMLSFWSILHDEAPAGPNFSTPEGALRTLEDAYRSADVEQIIACKDFVLESMFLLPGGSDIPEVVRDATVTVLEARFREDMLGNPPDWEGISASITGREDLPGDMVILTERLEFPSGENAELQIFVGKRDESWKVVVPYSDEMRESWLQHQTADS